MPPPGHSMGETGPCNLHLLCVLPIVVSYNKRAVTTAQLDHWIGERSAMPKLASDGPSARTPTHFDVVPVTMKPLITTPWPVSTRARPEMFNASAGKAVTRKTCPPEP